jgi:hypothetical protein
MDCSLNVDICDVIASNFYTKEYILEEWVIASGNFSYNNLSSNPLAIDFLKKNPQFIDYNQLSLNTNPEAIILYTNNKSDSKAISILKANSDKINWNLLSSCATRSDLMMPSIKDNSDRIDWTSLFTSTVIRANNNNWYKLSRYSNDIKLLQENLDEIIWEQLSANPYALEILKDNQHNIDWDILSSNTNPDILKLFTEDKLKKLKNPQFSSNIGACEFLKSHPQYITDEIGKMPYIFKKAKVLNKSAEIKSVLNMILAS